MAPGHRFGSLQWVVAAAVVAMASVAGAEGGMDALLQGMLHLQRGELKEARNLLTQAIEADSADAFAHLQLGIAQARLGDFSGARASFGHSYRLSAEDPWSSLWLGICALRDRDLDEAESWCRKTLQTDPFNADARYLLGTISHLRGDWEGAVRELTRARDAHSTDPETHFRLALTYHSLGMMASAELEYRRALALDSRHIRAMSQLGWLEYNSGRRTDAITRWKRALTIAPGYTDASLSLSQVYDEIGREQLAAGDIGGALTNWKESLRYNPTNRAAKHYIQRYGKE